MNLWLVRPYPHRIKRLDLFRAKDIIAIGWPCISDLTNKSRNELKTILAASPYQLSGHKLGNAYATLDIFVNKMQIGDLVLVPDDKDIFFCKITSDYKYTSNVDNTTDGYPHQRKVSWLTHTYRSLLSPQLQASLKVQTTAACLSKYASEIRSLTQVQQSDMDKEAAVTYPLRPDFWLACSIPSNFNNTEKIGLSTYIQNISIP